MFCYFVGKLDFEDRLVLDAPMGFDILSIVIVGFKHHLEGHKMMKIQYNPPEQPKKTGCLGHIGDEILLSYVGVARTITRIPIKQPV